MDRAVWDDSVNLAARGRALALEHGIMSSWTAFVAVDSSRVTESDGGTTVPVPDGVKYETTVSGGPAALEGG